MFRRGALRVVPACAVLTAIAAACASFGSGGDQPGADAGPSDGGEDAPASPPPPPPADAGPSTFCADASWVCDDFDDPPMGWPAPQWTIRDPDADVALTDAASPPSPSRPNAAVFTLQPSTTGLTAEIMNTLAGALTAYRCELQIFIEEYPSSTIDLVFIRLFPDDAGDGIGFASGGNVNIDQQGASYTPLSTNAWTKVVFDVVLGKSVSMTINGVEQPLGMIDAGGGLTSATGISIALGASRSGSSPSMRGRVLYDDVRCDVH